MPENKQKEQARILGIDFGLKRVGMALSDPLRIFAYPYQTLSNDKNLWNEIKKIIDEKNVEKIILGYPLRENGLKSQVTEEIEKFQKDLKSRFRIEVILWDERYTSVMAQEKILESVTKKSKRMDKGLLDMNSAAIILQEYLNSLN
jgi:putative holliday junction resolvase